MRAEIDPTDLGLSILPPESEHACSDGWLGEDDAGRPIPCLTCKPHLRPKSHIDGRTAWTVQNRTNNPTLKEEQNANPFGH